jgi:hypothetical protein
MQRQKIDRPGVSKLLVSFSRSAYRKLGDPIGGQCYPLHAGLFPVNLRLAIALYVSPRVLGRSTTDRGSKGTITCPRPLDARFFLRKRRLGRIAASTTTP